MGAYLKLSHRNLKIYKKTSNCSAMHCFILFNSNCNFQDGHKCMIILEFDTLSIFVVFFFYADSESDVFLFCFFCCRPYFSTLNYNIMYKIGRKIRNIKRQ